MIHIMSHPMLRSVILSYGGALIALALCVPALMFGAVARHTDWAVTRYGQCHGAPDTNAAKFVLPLCLKVTLQPRMGQNSRFSLVNSLAPDASGRLLDRGWRHLCCGDEQRGQLPALLQRPDSQEHLGQAGQVSRVHVYSQENCSILTQAGLR